MRREWLLAVIFVLGCSAVDSDEFDGSQQHLDGISACGLSVYASPTEPTFASDPCEGGIPVFQDVYVRHAGPPLDVSTALDLPEDGQVCVRVSDVSEKNCKTKCKWKKKCKWKNGKKKCKWKKKCKEKCTASKKVTAAWVNLDGQQVATPSDFPTPDTIQAQVDATDGSDLNVRLAGIPGSRLEVEVLFAPGASSFTTEGEQGLMSVGALGTDHPLLLPLESSGFHNTTTFIAGVFPNGLVGEHEIHYAFVIRSLDSCEDVARLEGVKAINSPTYFGAQWDGLNGTGDVVPPGQYAYFVEVDIVEVSSGTVVDSGTSEARGMLVDHSDLIFDRQFTQTCNPLTEDCSCGGLPASHCQIITYSALVDPRSPTADLSEVITTTFDENGRATVHVDLRNFNGGGLVPLKTGVWASLGEVKDFISEITGVPASADELFPFDYVQNGWSTILQPLGPSPYSSGHFLMDLISDGQGRIPTAEGVSPILPFVEAQLDDDYSDAPEGWERSIREGMGCSFTGNTDGESELKSRQCSLATAIELGGGLGLHQLETRVFDTERNGAKFHRTRTCTFFPVFQCTYRSLFNPESIATEHRLYRETEEGMVLDRTVKHEFDAADRVVVSFQRGDVSNSLDGVCSRTVVGGDALMTRLDTADGAVSESCITNGVFYITNGVFL